MSTLHAVKPYDQVLDAQKHYRVLLQSTARPGSIGQFDDAAIEVPSQLNRSTALIVLTLLSADVTYFLDRADAAASAFIEHETLAVPTEADRADFLILADPRRTEALSRARTGHLHFPEQAATVIAQVDAISPAPLENALRLIMTGPGIENQAEVFVLGVSREFFLTLREKNAEFPMGIDVYFTCNSLSAGPCVLALPRTTCVACEQI